MCIYIYIYRERERERGREREREREREGFKLMAWLKCTSAKSVYVY